MITGSGSRCRSGTNYRSQRRGTDTHVGRCDLCGRAVGWGANYLKLPTQGDTEYFQTDIGLNTVLG